jgi:hypothetical protein
MLLERDVDPFIKDPRGKFALQLAEHQGYTDVVELLRPLSVPLSLPYHDFN